MNFAETVYLSNIKEKSYIQIKRSTDWLHHWFVWIYSNTKHQAEIKLLERKGQIIIPKKLLPKNIKAKFDNLETPIFPNGVSWFMIHLYKIKQDPFIYILKSYFRADINCLYQTEKRHN